MRRIIERVIKICNQNNAITFYTSFSYAMQSFGFTVYNEMPCRYNGKNGYIDVGCTNGRILYLFELDRTNPRKKSIDKILQYRPYDENVYGYVVTRTNLRIVEVR